MAFTTEQMRLYMRNKRQVQRAWAKEFLGNKCASCSSTENLEFDHIKATSKLDSIANLFGSSFETLKTELLKCQILCKDCHVTKTKTNKEFGIRANKILGDRHGKSVGYSDGCRCDRCKTWKKNYRIKLVDSMNQPLKIKN